MKYDVGILGWWYGENYGSMLTYYALQKTIKDFGYKPIMIHESLGYNGWRVLWDNNIEPMQFARRCGYEYTNQQHFSLNYRLNELADAFVVGSDQLWNPAVGRVNDDLLLDFVEDSKLKIAYATSFGSAATERYTLDIREKYARLLKRFTSISVREEYGVEKAKNLFGVQATHVLDPVFLLDYHDYSQLADKATTRPTGEYLLAVILDPSADKKRCILAVAKKLNLKKIVIITDASYKAVRRAKGIYKGEMYSVITDVKPENYLNAYRNARYVITDSFHGSAFAFIFRKPFSVFFNTVRGADRFHSLMSIFALGETRRIYVENSDSDIMENENISFNIDFTTGIQTIEIEKRRSMEYLRKALDRGQGTTERIDLDKAITQRLDMYMCTGCSACVNICPHNALILCPDELGYFRTSLVSKIKCTNCGICLKTCPALELPANENNIEPLCYMFVASEDEVLMGSSSGGFFKLISDEILGRQGHVVGAAWKEDFSVEHVIVSRAEDLHKLQKSKYLQSQMGYVFRRIRDKLEANDLVLFSGTPCQVVGLNAFLSKEYENLITIDLLCGNAPSTEFFRKYMESSFPDGIIKYEFREKKRGWDAITISVENSDGTISTKRGGEEDDYQKVYHNHTMCPLHCEHCKYQRIPRVGDLTMGDFWGIENHDSELETSKGVSAILGNNVKGLSYLMTLPLDKIKVMKEVPLAWLGGNGYARGNNNFASPIRDVFYDYIKTMSFADAVHNAFKPNAKKLYDNYYEIAPPLQFNTNQLRFRFDAEVWEEKYMDGILTLSVKPGMDKKKGRHAAMPLLQPLKKDNTYVIKVKFRINSESDAIYFHIKDSSSRRLQVIAHCKLVVDGFNPEWKEIHVIFQPNSDVYDEFAIGATQVCGENNFIGFEYISINEIS